MFKKLVAVVGTLLLAAGISVVAVAAPASAHTPTHTISCSTLTFKGTQYETRAGNATPNRATIVIDGTTVLDEWFGKTLPLKSFTFDPTTSHTWSITVDAVGGTKDTQYDWNASGVTTPCSYPKPAMTVTCEAITIDWGRALDTALVITSESSSPTGPENLVASVVKGVAGGYLGLGLQVGDVDPVPLTEQQVKSGRLIVDYPVWLERKGVTSWVISAVFAGDLTFKGDLECNVRTPAGESAAEITITPATCDAGESVVLGGTKNATWGKVDGAYRVVATADTGFLFPAGEGVSPDGTSKTFTGTLAGPLDRNDPSCATAVTPVAPTLVTVTQCGVPGSVSPVAVTGVTYTTTFDAESGAYTVTATPDDGYYFAGDADQVITFSGNVGAFSACQERPDARVATGACVYTTDGRAAARTVVITFDNSASNTAVLFRVTSLPAYDRTVAAGAIETVTISGIAAAGVDYQVTTGSSTFDLRVPPCDEPVKPEPQSRSAVTEAFECSTTRATITTVTYTTDWAFNTATLTWEKQAEVAGAPVVTTRGMTTTEITSECGSERPDARIAVGACVYDPDATAQPRTVVITYDNSASTVAVLFRVTSLSAYDRLVAPGAVETITVPTIGAAGVEYQVTAGLARFDLTVAPCIEPLKPEPQTRESVIESFECAASEVVVTTVTSTSDWIFNTATATWEKQSEVASAPVVTTRAMKAAELTEQCGQASIPVAPIVTAVTACGVAGSVTPATTEGVSYVVEFTPATGAYVVTATPAAGYYFAGDPDQTVVFAGSVGASYSCDENPAATLAVGACVYTTDGSAEPRTAVITYDNTASTTAVLFSITSLSAYDRVVAAGAIETVTITGIGAAGVSYDITAGGSTFDVAVPPCVEPVQPEPTTREVVSELVSCSPSEVEVTTMTFTTDYAFNTATVTWEAQPEVAGAPVVTSRPMAPSEVTANCATAVDTDPFVSVCSVVSPADAPSSSWIYVEFDPRVIYTITNTQSGDRLIATDFYTSVPAGPYVVRASAAPGYELLPTAEEVWTYIVEDTANCELPTEAIVVPTLTWAPPTCSASTGTLTLGELAPGTIRWTANGDPIELGTHSLPAGSWTLQASPVDSGDALDAEWVDPVTLSVPAQIDGCGDLPTLALTTLALTGSSPTGAFIGLGVLLQLAGGVLLMVRRRMRAY